MYAEVAVNSTFPHRQAFSYAIPDGLDVHVGSAVHVPVRAPRLAGDRRRSPRDAGVLAAGEDPRAALLYRRRGRSFDPRRIALALWISDSYIAPLFDAVALMLPPGFERKPLTIVRSLVDAAEIDGLDLTPRQREALAAVVGRARRWNSTICGRA